MIYKELIIGLLDKLNRALIIKMLDKASPTQLFCLYKLIKAYLD